MAEKKYDSLRANWKCALACVLVSLSPFQYGVDFGLIGGKFGQSPVHANIQGLTSNPGMQAMIGFMQIFGYREPDSPVGWNISPERQQLISSLMTLGAVVASGMAGPLSYKLGRKSCLWMACALCAVSDVIMSEWSAE
jgi:MFS family permease